MVEAEDPDGETVTSSLASGGVGRFAVGSADGAVRYVGPGEDYETEPNRYEMTVRASDPHGAEAQAQVVVAVVNVNEPPEAEDDEAETAEDVAVMVDVLANDTDPDGTRCGCGPSRPQRTGARRSARAGWCTRRRRTTTGRTVSPTWPRTAAGRRRRRRFK